ncbi:MAG TPA: hypothetical protein VEP90_30810 [Methylomirabilota bacterium]|nr:hypothetical protein [Methylomirabilota bacterium]
MKIRSENTEINIHFATLLSKRNDLRIGQMIYNALNAGNYRIEAALFLLEDDKLIQLIEEMLK